MKLPFEPRHFTTLLLFGLILLLIWTIGTELGWGRRVNVLLPQPKLQKNRPTVLPLQPEFVLLPLEQSYSEILARPLFVSSRRPLPPKFVPRQHSPSSASTRSATPPPPAPPPVPVAIEPPKPTMRKGQFIVDGIIITKDKNIALLREIATRKMVRVELGQEINGMQIEKLDRDKITFKQGDEREEVVLKIKTVSGPGKSGSPHVPAQSAAPAVPPPGAPVAAPEQNAGDPQSVFERRRALRQQPPE